MTTLFRLNRRIAFPLGLTDRWESAWAEMLKHKYLSGKFFALHRSRLLLVELINVQMYEGYWGGKAANLAQAKSRGFNGRYQRFEGYRMT